MEDKPLSDSGKLTQEIVATSMADEDLCAQSVDLSQWFSTGLTPTGSFDLGIVAATQFGNLLDALPIPILMIDGSYEVVFANKACAKLSSNYERIQGVPFTTLVPRPRNAEKARSLLRKVFSTRRPQVADGIIQMEAKKIWGRLHFCAIRIGRQRYVLVLIEDLTGEKTQLLLNRRDDSQYQKARQELEKHVVAVSAELDETRTRLTTEKRRHVKTLKALAGQTGKACALAELVDEPVVVIAENGASQYVNAQFRQVFDYPDDQLPDIADWWQRLDLTEAEDAPSVMSHLDVLADPGRSNEFSTVFALADGDGSEKRYFLKVLKPDGGGYIVVCRESRDLGQ